VARIQDELRRWQGYVHDPVNTTIAFRASDGSFVTQIADNLGAFAVQYLFLSPFTTWTIVVDPKAHKDLDLSDVKEVTLTFAGYFLPPKTP
jgi:hypothetical protein